MAHQALAAGAAGLRRRAGKPGSHVTCEVNPTVIVWSALTISMPSGCATVCWVVHRSQVFLSALETGNIIFEAKAPKARILSKPVLTARNSIKSNRLQVI
jgi:hypothetical protein